MELRGFDNELKEKLEGRKITPSASSWEKLAENMDKEQTKTKNSFWWSAIAAVFIGGIVIGGLIFNPGESAVNKNGVVKEAARNRGLEKSVNPSKDLLIPETEIVAPLKSSEVAFQKKETQKAEKTVRKNIDTKSALKNSITQQNNPISKPIYRGKEINGRRSQENEFLAATEITVTSDTEIDNLLNEAQSKLKTRAFLVRPTNEINAQALLESVEIKSEQSTKDRILNTVHDKLIQLASTNRIFN